MTTKVATSCRTPRCPAVAGPRGLCVGCSRAYERRRGTAAQRGYGATHRRWRAAILARDPVCRACGQAPSREADHITPLSQGGGWSLENGQGLCKPCHSRKTMTRDGGTGPSKISDGSYLPYRTAS